MEHYSPQSYPTYSFHPPGPPNNSNYLYPRRVIRITGITYIDLRRYLFRGMPVPAMSPPNLQQHHEILASLRLLIIGVLPPPPSVLDPGLYVAMDCEMVGIGALRPKKRNSPIFETESSSLARVSIVNHEGYILLDTFVQQQVPVTDYRTPISGVRPEDLVGPRSLPFAVVRAQVLALLHNRILVGHAVHNDLAVGYICVFDLR